MRKPIVAGNWKMHKTLQEALQLVQEIQQGISVCPQVEVVVCPPFTALAGVGAAIAGTPLKLGAQNMHWEKSGAFTGEIAPAMLQELNCHYVIIGHSERRSLFGETDALVNRKLQTALAHNLRPIVCVGETLAEREAGQTETVIATQVQQGLKGLTREALASLVIAYEPVWAIGTGLTATPDQAQAVHHFIRELLQKMADAPTAAGIRLQYGGSVKPANAQELFAQPDIDGGLIGGAALDAAAFIAIVKAALC